MPDTDEFPVMFECQRHQGALRLTTTTCAGLWQRARRSHEDALIRLAPCIGCPVGAANAGVRIRPAAPAQAIDTGLSCVRCGQSGARRLIGSRLCVSCYNRQREYEAGRNAKGGEPTQYRPLFGCVIGAVTETGDVRPLRVDMVGSHLEAALTVARAAGAVRFGRVAPSSPATPCPAMPRRQAVFALAKPPA